MSALKNSVNEQNMREDQYQEYMVEMRASVEQLHSNIKHLETTLGTQAQLALSKVDALLAT